MLHKINQYITRNKLPNLNNHIQKPDIDPVKNFPDKTFRPRCSITFQYYGGFVGFFSYRLTFLKISTSLNLLT